MGRTDRRKNRRRHTTTTQEVLKTLADQHKALGDMAESATVLVGQLRELTTALEEERRRYLYRRIRYLLRQEIHRRIHNEADYRVMRMEAHGDGSGGSYADVTVEHTPTGLRATGERVTTSDAIHQAQHTLQVYLTDALFSDAPGRMGLPGE